MFDSLAKAGKYLGQAAKLMIGMPDYDNYVEHMRVNHCLLYTSPSPRDRQKSRMPSSA